MYLQNLPLITSNSASQSIEAPSTTMDQGLCPTSLNFLAKHYFEASSQMSVTNYFDET